MVATRHGQAGSEDEGGSERDLNVRRPPLGVSAACRHSCRCCRRRQVPPAAVAFPSHQPCVLPPVILLLQRRRSSERRRVDPVIKEVCSRAQSAALRNTCSLAAQLCARAADHARPSAARLLHQTHRPPGSRWPAQHIALPPTTTMLLQAPKRGLDVDKLGGSRTPAWRNLRGRGSTHKKRSYYEGERWLRARPGGGGGGRRRGDAP